MSTPRRTWPTFGRVVLVAASVLAATSFGFQVVAVWILVPLLWRAARDAGRLGAAGWAVLAALLTGPSAVIALAWFSVPLPLTYVLASGVVVATLAFIARPSPAATRPAAPGPLRATPHPSSW